MTRLLKLMKKNFSISNKAKLIQFDYSELADKKVDLSSKIKEAYGHNGLGASIINNVPNFEELRETQMINTLKLSQEPKEIIDKLRTQTFDSIGWDERKLYSLEGQVGGEYGSFYARYPRETVVYPEDPQLEQDSKNVWPDTIPNFRENFNKLNRQICNSLVNLMYHTDKYFNKEIPGYDFNMSNGIGENYVNTSRTIIYKPLPRKDSDQFWENWHTDFGLFTSVAMPIYFSKNLERLELKNSSFHFKDRQGNIHEANFDTNQMLVSSQGVAFILSAGLFSPLPHYVKATEVPCDIYRLQHVSFFEPQYNYKLKIPTGETFKELVEKDPLKFSYSSLKNFKQGTSYKEFCESMLKQVIDNQ